tara:strand:- start:3751 stop:4041 length:291 start_codon:yes stop_codon:yes gene_type:complete
MPDKFKMTEEGDIVPVPKDILTKLLEAVGILPMEPLLRVGVETDYEGPSRESMAVAGSVDKPEAYRSLLESIVVEGPDDRGEEGIINIIFKDMEEE